MNSGRGELTLFTSSSFFIRATSLFPSPEAVVIVESVSIDEESEQLPSVSLGGGGPVVHSSGFLPLSRRRGEGWILTYIIPNKPIGGVHISKGQWDALTVWCPAAGRLHVGADETFECLTVEI